MNEEAKDRSTDTEPKIGVYVCHCGGNISDQVVVEQVTAEAEKLPNVTVARRNMFMCSDPGQEMILEDIKSGKVNRVVVASCAPSLHETTFRNALVRAGMNPYLYEHANIREQVSWVHHGEAATEKAASLVAAAAAKCGHLTSLEPIRVEAVRHATVIGGGVAGMSAACNLAKRGVNVTLLEKSPFLGGQAAKLDKVYPTAEKAGDLIAELASEVLSHPDIDVVTCAQVTGAGGYVGDFHLTVKRTVPQSDDELRGLSRVKESGAGRGDFVPFVGVCPASPPEQPETVDIHTGVIVMATGFEHYVPRQGEYGYREFPEVVTQPEFIRLMAEETSEGDVLTINGRAIKSVAMIHCVGSRHIPGIHEPDENGRLNEYCSRVCCTGTLQAAGEVKKRYPETVIYDFYRDIRTYGRGHEEYYVNASSNNVLFMRFEPQDAPVVSRSDDDEYALKVTAKDTLLSGEEIEVPVDLVVLAVGMQPSPIDSLIDIMKLPVGADRFLLEVHPKLRPVETAVNGVLLAGTCQAPMDITESSAAATAAAVKAAAVLIRGYVELDPFVAVVDEQACTGCGACVEACLREGALSMKEKEVNGVMKTVVDVNPALCEGCGVCVAVCPTRAIQVAGWTLQQYEAMVDAIVG